MDQSRFDRIEIVDVKVNSTTILKFPVGDRDNLRDVRVNAIQLIPVSKCSLSPVSQRPVVSATTFLKSSLTLSVQGEESINGVPLTVFNPADNDGRLFVFSVPKVIDWEKSHFDLVTGAADALESFVMAVFYEKNR